MYTVTTQDTQVNATRTSIFNSCNTGNTLEYSNAERSIDVKTSNHLSTSRCYMGSTAWGTTEIDTVIGDIGNRRACKWHFFTRAKRGRGCQNTGVNSCTRMVASYADACSVDVPLCLTRFKLNAWRLTFLLATL